jgi:acyl-CoA synthetase (AMP-forming)/AMP-acid ligase II
VPDRTALVAGSRRLTYAELDERTDRLASALASRGIGKDDHVGLQLYNDAPFVESMIAAFKLRAVPININYRYVGEELRFLYENADLKAVVFQRELGPLVGEVAPGVKTIHTLVSVEDGSGAPPVKGGVDYETLLAAPTRGSFGPRSGEDLYVIYTGGTTGMPRGVMWRHQDVFYAGLQGGNPGGTPLESAEQVAPNAAKQSMPMTILPAAPLIHGAAQWATWIAMLAGGKVVLSPGRSFDPHAVCRAVAAERVTTITLVGDAMARPLVHALRELGGSIDMSSLFVISSAGAILSETVRDELQALLPHTMILNSFGASETGHQGTVMPMSPATPGRPSFFMDATNTVIDEEGRPVVPGSGTIGRLARRGYLPVGYYKDPAKTAATFLEIDGVRWVVPGDLATVDENGQIVIFGRGAVCINSGGEKVFPEEVEVTLKAHPAVEDAVVVGVPDERWGERVAAVVQPRPGAEALDLAALESHCRGRIAGYKVPRLLRVVDRVVRHPSGKPDYRWAKQAVLESQNR